MFKTLLPVCLNPHSRLCHYAFLILIAGLLLLSGNADLPLIDRDEPRFAEAAREMMERKDWIIPYFNHEYRFDKPPMSYWLMGASAGLLGGFSEFAVRLPTMLSALLTGLMIYEMGRRRFCVMTGLWASMSWLSCVQVLIHGRMAVADMPLIVAITAATWALWELLTRAYEVRRWQTVLYLSLSFGFLAKGPLAFICPLLSVLLYRLMFWRQPLPWQRLGLNWGLPLSMGLIGLWGIPALYLTEGQFWQQGIGQHVVERGMKPLNGRGFSPFFYLGVSLISLFPGIAWIGGVVQSTRRHWNADTAFLLSWLLGPYLIFSFYATQLSHYVLPAFPAACLLLARAMTDTNPANRWSGLILTLIHGGGLLAALILLLMGFYETYTPGQMPLRSFVLALAGVIGGLSLLGLMVRYKAYWLASGALLLVAFNLHTGSTHLRTMSPAVQLRDLFENMPANTDFYGVGYEEPSQVFYSHHRWKSWPGDKEGLSIIQRQGPKVIVLLKHEIRLEGYLARYLPFVRAPAGKPWSEARLQWVKALEAPDSGYRLQSIIGGNTARVSWIELDVWYKQE